MIDIKKLHTDKCTTILIGEFLKLVRLIILKLATWNLVTRDNMVITVS